VFARQVQAAATAVDTTTPLTVAKSIYIGALLTCGPNCLGHQTVYCNSSSSGSSTPDSGCVPHLLLSSTESWWLKKTIKIAYVFTSPFHAMSCDCSASRSFKLHDSCNQSQYIRAMTACVLSTVYIQYYVYKVV
jgi:hypothetical protein